MLPISSPSEPGSCHYARAFAFVRRHGPRTLKRDPLASETKAGHSEKAEVSYQILEGHVLNAAGQEELLAST